ncbi:hypothetical protein P7C73_g5598, partial [Tremellales sp. Uapishka_1]
MWLSLRPSRRKTAIVLVLGDVGRSPRMMYHAESLGNDGWETYLVGYGDTKPHPALLSNPHIHVLSLLQPPSLFSLLPWVLRAPIRIVYQIMSVLYICLYEIPFHTEILLVQNPPSIPTLSLAQLVSQISGSRLIIDWHNTGYSILAMRVGAASPLVKVAAWFERTFGRKAFAHLFVTNALKAYLVKEWQLEYVVIPIDRSLAHRNARGLAIVLHDRPPSTFKPTDPITKHELFLHLTPTFSPPLPASILPSTRNSTLFTHVPSTLPLLHPDRPALVVSSTSWTADEDFSLLLTALDIYQAAINAGEHLPRLVVVITGKGALRAAFERQVVQREIGGWNDVFVRCVFLPTKDYPTLLGCADLGVSLHSSSSGRDLPMKVVDMFGSRLPVLARDFACLHELVKDGENGRVFQDGDELGRQLAELMRDFPNGTELARLKEYFSHPDKEWSSWEDNWKRVMRGVIRPRKVE